jgi:hypothetical protein
MAIDLTGPRKRVRDRVLVDRVTLTANPATAPVDPIDDSTGLPVTSPDADATVLAVNVPCVVRERDVLETVDDDTVVKVYDVSLGFDEAPADVPLGTRVTITLSSDTELQGLVLYVRRVNAGTLRVTRKLECTRRFDASNRG